MNNTCNCCGRNLQGGETIYDIYPLSFCEDCINYRQWDVLKMLFNTRVVE